MDRRHLLSAIGSAAFIPASAIGSRAYAIGCSRFENMACSAAPDSISPSQFALSAKFEIDEKYNEQSDVFHTSGDETFDAALYRVLYRLGRIFDTRPSFQYYQEDQEEKSNAWIVRAQGQAAHQIYFGLNMLREYLERPAYGDLTVLTLCAHEFGHAKQFDSGATTQRYLQESPCYYAELHADFAAGYGLQRYLRDYMSNKYGVHEIFEAWPPIGAQGISNLNDPGTHGTPRERRNAIREGFLFAQRREDAEIWAAISAGILFLKG